jgi:hypothetical protein
MVRSLGILSTVDNQDYEVAGYNNRAEDNRVSRPVYQNACPPRAEGHMTSRPKLKQLSQGEGTEGNTTSRVCDLPEMSRSSERAGSLHGLISKPHLPQPHRPDY